MQKTCVIGVDLGGTNVRAGAFYEDGSPAGEKFSNPSHGQEGTELIVKSISDTILQAIHGAEVPPTAIGMAIPGFIDDAAGLIRWAPNFGGMVNGVFENWTDIPMRSLLAKTIDTPIHMGNDANLAAFGEYKFGSGKNTAHCLVLFTLGTGIGSGVIMRPEAVFGKAQGPLMLLGGNKGGVELGHMIIEAGGLDCNAGTYGAIEAYAQRDSIVKRATHRLMRGRESMMRDMVKGDLGTITPLIISQAASAGDELAIEVWYEVGVYLGVAIGNAINIFAPDVVAVGGQIAKAGDFILEPARKTARNVAIPALFKDAKILEAEQIADAGMLGGAAMAIEAHS
ncbi:MAG TPA: ROK family protein [Fimbriimonadaceae bacterium]